MRQKRAKTYRKLLHKYSLHFGFREPYQVLLDDSFVCSLCKQKITDPYGRVGDVVQASATSATTSCNKIKQPKVKLMITQCAMVALYDKAKEDQLGKDAVLMAKEFERRKCNHREAIDPHECIMSVLGE